MYFCNYNGHTVTATPAWPFGFDVEVRNDDNKVVLKCHSKSSWDKEALREGRKAVDALLDGKAEVTI